MRQESPPLAFEPNQDVEADEGMDLFDLLELLRQHLVLLIGGSLAAGLITLGITYLIMPTFTATTAFLPPQ